MKSMRKVTSFYRKKAEELVQSFKSLDGTVEVYVVFITGSRDIDHEFICAFFQGETMGPSLHISKESLVETFP